MAFVSPLRKEVRDFHLACEYLISASRTKDDPQFSREEREIIEFYVLEVSKVLDQMPQVKQHTQDQQQPFVS